MLAGDQSKSERLARIFQDRVSPRHRRELRAATEDGKVRRRILHQIGTPRADEELAALKCALKGRDVLAALSSRLPLQIGNLANAQLEECKQLIEGAAARDGELFLYALLTVMNRMTAPWQLIRLGVKAAGSDTAARVAETNYAVAVNIVLAEQERLVAELREDLRSGQGVAVGALLKTIHDFARGLRTELELPVDSTWGRALAAQRTQISDLLRAEIESMPDRVRRLLKPRTSKEIRPSSVLNPNEVAEVEALVEFVGICRYFAGELAINEMTQRALTDLRQYLDNGTRVLLEGLRTLRKQIAISVSRRSMPQSAFAQRYSVGNTPRSLARPRKWLVTRREGLHAANTCFYDCGHGRIEFVIQALGISHYRR